MRPTARMHDGAVKVVDKSRKTGVAPGGCWALNGLAVRVRCERSRACGRWRECTMALSKLWTICARRELCRADVWALDGLAARLRCELSWTCGRRRECTTVLSKLWTSCARRESRRADVLALNYLAARARCERSRACGRRRECTMALSKLWIKQTGRAMLWRQ